LYQHCIFYIFVWLDRILYKKWGLSKRTGARTKKSKTVAYPPCKWRYR